MSADPTRIASAPASSAAAPCARVVMPDSATTTRSRGARATSSSCASRSIRNEARSRALIPITGASSRTARSSSSASCASTSVSRPSSAACASSADARGVVEIAKEEQGGVRACVARGTQVVVCREEPLGEQRHGRGGARRPQVVPRSPEALVDEDGDRRCSGTLVGRGERCRVGVRAQVTGRRRAALDLRDRPQAWRAERGLEPSHQAPPREKRDELVEPLERPAAVECRPARARAPRRGRRRARQLRSLPPR